MCLGVPGKVVEILREEDVLMAQVQFGGITKRVC
ncbi:MAG TPA: HypC/HybG/HupF family hydrogenase formation chaperone, partial [Planctomycetota bacterium]|nr:HypC/HybG/HupF family hydrogenase formation chaperone [Planctomycetota bacterium]